MITFCTYAPIMVERFFSEKNLSWKLLLKIRYQISFLILKQFDTEQYNYLDCLITEHHQLYISLFGTLTPKRHSTRYNSLIISMMGPPVHLWSMRF